jgi:hypothetical protein
VNRVEGAKESMDLWRHCWVVFVLGVISLVCSVIAGETVHEDDLALKKPGWGWFRHTLGHGHPPNGQVP